MNDYMDIVMEDTMINPVNELFGFKKNKKETEIRKYKKFADELLDSNNIHFGEIGYNKAEAIGTILALKFLNITEDKIKKALKDAKKHVIKFSDYDEDEIGGIDKDQDIILIYNDEDRLFLNLKDNKFYHIDLKSNKIKPVSLYSIVNNSYEKIYFNKKEFDNIIRKDKKNND